MQERCDEYFILGHTASALQLVSSRCDFFGYSERLEEMIAQRTAMLQTIDTPIDTFITIQNQINQLQQAIKNIKQDTIVSQAQQKQEMTDLTTTCTQYHTILAQQQQLKTSQQLLREIADCIKQTMEAQQTVSQHCDLVQLLDDRLAQAESGTMANALDTIREAHQRLQSIPPLSGSVKIMKQLEQESIPRLRALGIEAAGELDFAIQELKQRIKNEIIYKTLDNWVVLLKKVAKQIGCGYFQHVNQKFDTIVCSDIIKQCFPTLGDIEIKDFGEIDSDITNEVKKSEQISTHQGLLSETLASAAALGWEREALEQLQKRFQRSVQTDFSAEDILKGNYNRMHEVLGMLSIIGQMPQLMTERARDLHQQALVTSLLALATQFEKLPLQNMPLNQLYKQELILSSKMTRFLLLLRQTDLQTHLERPEQGLNKVLFQRFLTGFSPLFVQQYINPLFQQIQVHDKYEAQQAMQIAMQFSHNLYCALLEYCHKVACWLDPILPQFEDTKIRVLVQSGLTRQLFQARFQTSQLVSALADVFFTGIQMPFEQLIQTASDFNQFAFIMTCYYMLSGTMTLTFNSLDNLYHLDTQHHNIFSTLTHNKFYQIFDSNIEKYLIQTIQAQFVTIDLDKRYSKKHDNLHDLFKQISTQISTCLYFVPESFKQQVIVKQIQLLLAEQFVYLFNNPQPFITHSNVQAIVADLFSFSEFRPELTKFQFEYEQSLMASNVTLQELLGKKKRISIGEKKVISVEQVLELQKLVFFRQYQSLKVQECDPLEYLKRLAERQGVLNDIQPLVDILNAIMRSLPLPNILNVSSTLLVIIDKIKCSGKEKTVQQQVLKLIKK